jgi:phosphatidate cytidylyltransferase
MEKSDVRIVAAKSSGLRSRAFASAFMLALGILAFAVGFCGLAAVAVISAALMIREYDRLWAAGSGFKFFWDLVSVVGVLAAFSALYGEVPAYCFVFALVLLAGVSLAANVALDRSHWILESLPPLYIGLPLLSFLYVYDAAGPYSALYVLVITVSTDVGAYFTGLALKGPKLAPSISPGKTWSGAVGGLMCAFALGTTYKILLLWNLGLKDFSSVYVWALASLSLSVLSQAGDLFESRLKRMAGVKDSGGLIPGHGGVLDRLDSLLFVAPALALLVAFTKLGYTGL